MIEIVMKRRGKKLPPLGEGCMRYVIAENGVFLERRTGSFTTVTAVGTIHGGLEAHDEKCLLHVPRLPVEMVAEMLCFFRWAYAYHGGEAVLCLLYHPERRGYLWHCPEQSVELWEGSTGAWYGGTDILYSDPIALPDGYVLWGDVHSHAHMNAYASSTDQDDERYKDGLHVIVGRLDRTEVELHIDFVMDGRRFAVDPEELIPWDEITEEGGFPDEWREQVVVERRPYIASTWARAPSYLPTTYPSTKAHRDDRNGGAA